MISKLKKKGIWWIYVIISPLLFYIAYQYFPSGSSIISVEYSIFIALGILVALYPIRTEDSIIFLINGLSLSAFVLFGLFAELIVTSIAIVALMLRSNIKLDEHYRYALNLLMFQIISTLAAVSYYSIQQLVPQLSLYEYSLAGLTLYILIHFIVNQGGMYLINRYYYNRKEAKLIDEHLNISAYATILILPFSFILIYLYEELNATGVLIGAIPFVTITIGTNFFYKSKMNDTYLKKVNLLAQDLTEKKKNREVIETYLRSLVDIFPVDALTYFTVSPSEEINRVVVYQENKGIELMSEEFLVSNRSILKRALGSKDILYYSRSAEWQHQCINDIAYPAESALILPVIQQDGVTGLILLSHKTQNMYNNMVVSLLKILHKYFAIALDNASQYEQLEENSEKDYLTSLPNLKSFSKQLEIALSVEQTSVSLIVLDLDHFKKINDTYGHQAGNELLKQVASLLVSFENQGVCVSRYGGEEFLVLVTGPTKKVAGDLAESIRMKIERHDFDIHQSMNNTSPTKVSITASMGVANYPEDCKEAEELITLADRAMYIGSKQKGRNRVTVFKRGKSE